MEFLTEIARSASEKKPLLIYRSTANPSLCFKFSWKRNNETCRMYACVGCMEARNNGNSVVINSVGVSLDYGKFLSDPEKLAHKCIDLKFTFDYLATRVQQDLRLVWIEID